jgi:hypothetical protein
MQVQKLSGEAAASARQLELAGADLQAERDRAASFKGLVERKVGFWSLNCLVKGERRHDGRASWMRGPAATTTCLLCNTPPTSIRRPPAAAQRAKKRQWKGACVAADAEVASLHAALLGRQGQIEALEGRLHNLETEVGRRGWRRLVEGRRGQAVLLAR